MKLLSRYLNKLRTLGLIWLLCLGEDVIAQIKKSQTIQIPLGENSAITWGDFNQLNWKLNAAFISIIFWFVIEAWKSYRSSNDKTAETLEKLVKAVDRIEARLESTPTKVEVTHQIRDEIKYFQDIKDGG